MRQAPAGRSLCKPEGCRQLASSRRKRHAPNHRGHAASKLSKRCMNRLRRALLRRAVTLTCQKSSQSVSRVLTLINRYRWCEIHSIAASAAATEASVEVPSGANSTSHGSGKRTAGCNHMHTHPAMRLRQDRACRVSQGD